MTSASWYGPFAVERGLAVERSEQPTELGVDGLDHRRVRRVRGTAGVALCDLRFGRFVRRVHAVEGEVQERCPLRREERDRLVDQALGEVFTHWTTSEAGLGERAEVARRVTTPVAAPVDVVTVGSRAEVPLAHVDRRVREAGPSGRLREPCCVGVRAEELRERHLRSVEVRRIGRRRQPAALRLSTRRAADGVHPRARPVAPRLQRRATRRTVRRGGVGLREDERLPGEGREVRRAVVGDTGQTR
jgi:hypothetical protein